MTSQNIFRKAFVCCNGEFAIAREANGRRWFKISFNRSRNGWDVRRIEPRPTGVFMLDVGQVRIRSGKVFVGSVLKKTIKIVGAPICLSVIKSILKRNEIYSRLMRYYICILLGSPDADYFLSCNVWPDVLPELEQLVWSEIAQVKEVGAQVDVSNINRYHQICIEQQLHAHRRLIEYAVREFCTEG